MIINLTNPLTVSSSSIISAIGLFGLALYQFSQGDYGAAIQSVFAGLVAVGVKIGQDQHKQTLLQLQLMNKRFNP